MNKVKDWNEEVMKWLAVGMCLAMVGMAVMPAFQPVEWYFTLKYHPEGAALAAASTAYESIIIGATLAAAAATCGIGAPVVAAVAIMAAPTILE